MKIYPILSLLIISVFLACTKEAVDEPVKIMDEQPAVNINIAAQDTVISTTGSAEESELVAKTSIINLDTAAVSLRWRRVKKELTAGWESAICDTNRCYFPGVDSADFDVPAMTKVRLWNYFYPEGIAGEGSAEIRVYHPSNPNNFIRISYSGVAQ